MVMVLLLLGSRGVGCRAWGRFWELVFMALGFETGVKPKFVM
jgi:hypothetical protein